METVWMMRLVIVALRTVSQAITQIWDMSAAGVRQPHCGAFLREIVAMTLIAQVALSVKIIIV